MDRGTVIRFGQMDKSKSQNDSLFDMMAQKPTPGSIACFDKSPEAKDEGGLTRIDYSEERSQYLHAHTSIFASLIAKSAILKATNDCLASDWHQKGIAIHSRSIQTAKTMSTLRIFSNYSSFWQSLIFEISTVKQIA